MQSILTHQNVGLIHTINNQLKNRPKQLKTGNPNFPYLEKGLKELRHGTSEHNSSSDGLAELAEQRNGRRTRLVRALNDEIRRTALGSNYSRFRITYVE